MPNDISGLASWASTGLPGIAPRYKPSAHVIPFPPDKARSMIALNVSGDCCGDAFPGLGINNSDREFGQLAGQLAVKIDRAGGCGANQLLA